MQFVVSHPCLPAAQLTDDENLAYNHLAAIRSQSGIAAGSVRMLPEPPPVEVRVANLKQVSLAGRPAGPLGTGGRGRRVVDETFDARDW